MMNEIVPAVRASAYCAMLRLPAADTLCFDIVQ